MKETSWDKAFNKMIDIMVSPEEKIIEMEEVKYEKWIVDNKGCDTLVHVDPYTGAEEPY